MANHFATRAVTNQEAKRRVDDLSDEWLMKAHIEGDEACFAVLIKRYEHELFSYLRRLLSDAGLAEDVFQNTFLQVHLKRRLYEIGRPFRPWLYKVATHQAIDALRRQNRRQQASLNVEHGDGEHESPGTLLDMLEGNGPPPETCAEQNERRQQVRSAVDRLNEHLRVVIVLSYYQGLKYKEIAEALQIPVGTVKSRLHAAITRLGEEWERMGFARES